ncbi:MAG: protein kinase [Thermoanaerobaculales bacterium]|jgi:serine/threonine protein kinase/tetratricopeptide (TPR) repeat protein|nr:protein kinase [Thermoanaerobaculales bacterium]
MSVLGETLLHYQILRRLGAGGMGEVYLALDTKLGREVAIKVLPPELSADPHRLERFRREASIVAALNHPNIVTIFSVEESDGLHFFTMEYIDGRTLSELVPGSGLPAAELAALALPLVDALDAAHDRGVTHRDLKPGNIMVNRDGHLKVLDFGLSKVRIVDTHGGESDSLAETDFLTGHGQILGTTPYMSPEQLKGQPADQRSDIFALGTVFYGMATGKHPFNADSSAEIISSILSHAPPQVSSLRNDLPDELGAVVGRCLEKDPEGRFQTAGELREALSRAIGAASNRVSGHRQVDHDDPTEVVTPPSTPPSRAVRTTAAGWAGIGLAAVIVVTAGLWFWTSQDRDPEPPLRSLAVLPFTNLSGDAELDRLAEAISSGLVSTLREVKGVQVVGRTESRQRQDTGLEAMRRELAVGAVINGEIQQRGPELRNTVSLTDTGTGFVLWSHTYSTTADAAYRTQRAIAKDLETYLSIPLTVSDRRRMAESPDGSHAAYDYYVTGQRFLNAEDNAHGPDSAAENFRQALRIKPDFVLAHVGLSEALWQKYYRDGDRATLEEAESAAETACRIDPQEPTAQVALARVLRTTGRQNTAIEQLEEVLARHPRPDEAYRELGRSYERVGDLEAAEKAYRAATALNAGDWFAWNSLGTFLMVLGRYEEALPCFERSAELAPPDITRPQQQLATYHLHMGRFDQAIEAYERIPAQNRGPDLASNLGTAYYFSDRPNKWEHAEKSYLMAVRLSPKDAMYQANLGDLYAKIERHEEADERYRRAQALTEERVADDPGNLELMLQLALYSAKAHDCDAALTLNAELERTLAKTGPNAHQLGYVYAICGDDDAAVDAVRRAIELGQFAELIREEDEFRALHERPDFIALVE